MSLLNIPDNIYDLAESKEIEVTETKPTEIARAVHKGSYNAIGETVERLFQWIAANGYIPAGFPSSTYYNDPSTSTEEDLITEVFIPVKKR